MEEDSNMKKVHTLLAGSIALAMSLPALAEVSYVFVSNTNPPQPTLSLIRCVTSEGKNAITCQEKERQEVGFGTSWPANQYDGHPAWWWSGLSGQVIGVKATGSLSPLKQDGGIVEVDTYNVPGRPDGGANFIGIMPDGRTAWNSAREVDRIQEIDTDPDSPTFGTVLVEIPVPDWDPSTPETPTLGAARPCDATITPDGRFFLEPDLGGESLTIVDIETKQIIHQVLPERAIPDERVLPFMSTTNGKIVLVENLEGDNTYDIWDISNLPDPPQHLKKLTRNEGLGLDAQTSEFTPDGRYAYLIMRGDPAAPAGSPDTSRIDVLDVAASSSTYLDIVNSIELPPGCFASTGDFSKDGRYFFVNCNRRDEIVVVDGHTQTQVASIATGDGPRGVVVR
jgi:hypothetical protein